MELIGCASTIRHVAARLQSLLMFIDTHCHLTYPGLAESLPDVLARAEAAGVARMVTVGTSIADHQQVLALARTHGPVFAALGIHPHHAAETDEGYEGFLENGVKANPKVVALGECGLDYHYNYAPRLLQRGVFVNQLEIARRLATASPQSAPPVILHVREAHADALAILRDFPGLKFVVHCFTGTTEECRAWLDLGAYIGLTGIVTYKNADDLQATVKLVPPDRLLLETDAPYLSPEPVRKTKTNEPAHIAHTARFLADLRGVALDELAKQTSENAIRFYGSKIAPAQTSPAPSTPASPAPGPAVPGKAPVQNPPHPLK
jgi:TatD DNase family protein